VDFFEAQAEARRLSARLVLLFGAAVISMIFVVSLVLLVLFGVGLDGGVPPVGLFVVVALGMGLLIGGGSLARTAQLRKGGAVVAELLGGRRVDPGTVDPDERRLMNVVEEMALASGVPVPAVFVLEGESGINAFAAGHTLHDAAVAVTRGALKTFTREELQGVMAHEFSHILNGDMRLNIRLMGTLYGILLLTVVGRALLRSGSRSRHLGRSGGSGKNNSGAQIVALGLALVVLGYLGVFFGRLIQAAVSRQREFLADAAAVQFTRNPAGIAGALRRIQANASGSRIEDPHAQEAGHLFFAEGVRGFWGRALATHPPLPIRIARVDPGGTSPSPPGGARSSVPPMPGAEASALAMGFSSPSAIQTAGLLSGSAVVEARRFLADLPPVLRDATTTADGAMALVLALIWPPDLSPIARGKGVEKGLDLELHPRAASLAPHVVGLGPGARLPLLELAFPTLGTLEPAAAKALLQAVSALALEDGRVDPFDFALIHLLRKGLPGAATPGRRAGWNRPLQRVSNELAVLYSLVAQWADGPAPAPDKAQSAFSEALRHLPTGVSRGMVPVASDQLTLARVDAALDALEQTTPEGRRIVLEGVARILGYIERDPTEQMAVLRALSEALEVPIPAHSLTSAPPNP
jgi:Zn-dependent protease with chaperone function